MNLETYYNKHSTDSSKMTFLDLSFSMEIV